MAYLQSNVAPCDFAVTKNQDRARIGFFSWFVDLMLQSRQRHADREIERFLRNGKFTDESEREIARRFLPTPSHF